MRKHVLLVVDDEENILAILNRVLRGDTREIILAGNVRQGLEKMKSAGGADLVISDNKLPDGTGIDFLVKVRQLYPDAIRILITGYPDLESAIDAINKGQVYRFIPKPWENEELRLIVKQALDYGDALRDNRVLLNIARQQAELLRGLEKKYPAARNEEFDTMKRCIAEEQKISEALADFLKKYYPKGG
ncbi:MAG: response regulator [Candidatus Omnitrophota bacterium]|jgi:DNA-binding NtrC family response regulator